jgi:Xaa-Pro aminopeptidase
VIDGKPQGFIHSTGHGLGLDVHEAPRVSKLSQQLKAGHVVTVEPGLYYEKLGGIRIEDVVYVTKTGCEVLTRIPKIFEL